jgi:hypothetical protein
MAATSRITIHAALVLLVYLQCISSAFADTNVDLRRTAIVSTLSEAIVSVAAQIEERTGKRVHGLKWDAEFTDKTWTCSARGKANSDDLAFTISGSLEGNSGDELKSDFQGKGNAKDLAFVLDGNARWTYDAKRRDYHGTTFRQVMKFSQDSPWVWIVSGEVLVGGLVTGGVAVISAPLGPISWLALGTTVTGGMTTLISASSSIVAMTNPGAPPPPLSISLSEAQLVKRQVKPEKGIIYVALDKDGKIIATGPNGTTVMTGNFYNAGFGGKAAGSIE